MTNAEAESKDPQYSRAFEKLVQGPDDVVGLLAYANYKMAIREMYQTGQSVDLSARSLTPTSVQTYRSAAEQKMTEIVEDGIQAAAPDIRNSALMALIEKNHVETAQLTQTTRDEIKGYIRDRTGWGSSFLTNMAAWIVTIIIASLILFLASRASVEQTLADKLSDRPAASAQQHAVERKPQLGQDAKGSSSDATSRN